jgi:hypothetical protein
MNHRLYLFLCAVLLVVASLTSLWIYFHLRSRRLYSEDWEAILAKVVPVDKEKLRIVAADLLGDRDDLNQRGGPCEMDSLEILELIGGLEGLRVIQNNCAVLVDLACFCQRSYPEALAVAESLRLNAREIRWHLDRLTTAAQNGSSPAALGDYAQRAATIYYLMTRRLVALYDISNSPGAQAVQLSLA